MGGLHGLESLYLPLCLSPHPHPATPLNWSTRTKQGVLGANTMGKRLRAAEQVQLKT